jgi:hypothetical protein
MFFKNIFPVYLSRESKRARKSRTSIRTCPPFDTGRLAAARGRRAIRNLPLRILLFGGGAPRAVMPVTPSGSSLMLYRESRLMILIACVGPRHPRNSSFLSSSASVASKKFSSSSTARVGRRVRLADRLQKASGRAPRKSGRFFLFYS